MKEWEVWTEGYTASGERGDATFHGKFMGETFKDAVIKFRDTKCSHPELVYLGRWDVPDYWGCRFFDNEEDARRGFG